MSEKLLFDIFSGGHWIGMAEGEDEDDAKRMAARSLPSLMGRFTLVRWFGRRHPNNCRSSGGAKPDPVAEPLPFAAEEELKRAYRCVRGFYSLALQGGLPDKVFLGYHSLTIAAAIRFVEDGALDGSSYFEGKPVTILHETIARARASVGAILDAGVSGP